MGRKKRAVTSNDLIRENCQWPMTAGEVEELTGVTRRALQIYDEKGLLCPARSGEGVANNRKLYYPEDVDRLKQIVVLKYYGFDLKNMAPILDGEVTLVDALAGQIEALRARENYLKNLILFAQYAEIVGDDLFETLAFGTSEVDAFAEFLRNSPAYAAHVPRWQSMDDAGLERCWDELGSIIVAFLKISGDNAFAHIEEMVHRLRRWFCAYYFEVDDLDLLGLWAIFEDESEEAAFAQEIGDKSTAGFLQAAVFLVWLKAMFGCLAVLTEGASLSRDATDPAVSENRIVRLVDFVCRASGYPVPEAAGLDREEWEGMLEFFETVIGYLRRAVDDSDIMELMDPRGALGLDAPFLEALVGEARVVELFGSASCEG